MTIFVILAIIGFVILVASFLLGEIFEGVGDFAHDIAVDHEVHLDHPEEGTGPGPFSLRVIAAFVTGFGSFGAIASYYKYGPVQSSLVGLLSGLVTGGIVFGLVRIMYKQQAGSGVSMRNLVNMSGTVTVDIPKNGIGQVSVISLSSQSEHIAQSEDGEAIRNGTGIIVTKVMGDRLVVKQSQ